MSEMHLNGRLAVKRRKQICGVRGRALFFASYVMLPVLAGCSASTDPAGLSHQTIADVFSSSRSTTAPTPTPPATDAANTPVAQAAPSTYGANALVAPGSSPDQPAAPTAENPFYSLYNSLKDGTEECSLPSEPCDNNHRVQN
jgi:hypothetical protein